MLWVYNITFPFGLIILLGDRSRFVNLGIFVKTLFFEEFYNFNNDPSMSLLNSWLCLIVYLIFIEGLASYTSEKSTFVKNMKCSFFAIQFPVWITIFHHFSTEVVHFTE